ncbi:MAG: hypothetical protein IJA58_03915 [Lachnospiraceae bacterium]|nr:hypothetical protein [Lachnospiraceae bacterium]
MKKPTKIHYIASITLLLLFLAGCGKAENHVVALPEPEDTLKTEVETRLVLYEDREILWYDRQDETTWGEGVRYYGAVDGAEVFYFPRDGGKGGLDEGLYLYLDGKVEKASFFKLVKECSDETFQKIMELHRTYSEKIRRGSVFRKETTLEVGELSPEEQKAIESAWWNARNYELSWTGENNKCKFVGNYDGTVVIFESYSMGVLGMSPKDRIIGGLLFYGGKYMLAYRDGEIIDLAEAYERDWLDDEELATVQCYLYGINNVIRGDEQ